MRIRSILALAVAPVLLVGCGGGDPAADDDRTASGEVLEGSIGDAMIPLEQVKSQPPLARGSDAPGEDEDDAAADGPVDEAVADEGPGENPIYQDGFDG